MIKEFDNFIYFAENNEIPDGIPIENFFLQMRNIESEVGHKIIKTFQQKKVLTEFGRNFLPYAKKSLQNIHEGINVSEEYNYNIYDSDNYIVIGIARDSAYTWGINCIRNFNKFHPGLRLVILVDDSLTDDIINKSTIIFWCSEKDLPEYDKLWYIEYKYGLYASNDYIDNYGIPTLNNIKDHKIIAYSGVDREEITNWHLLGNKYGLPQLTPVIFSQSRDLITKMISEGVGIGSVSDHQDAYYGYENLQQVVKLVNGPVLKSYFFMRKGLNQQKQDNVKLFERLFRIYFDENKIDIFENTPN